MPDTSPAITGWHEDPEMIVAIEHCTFMPNQATEYYFGPVNIWGDGAWQASNCLSIDGFAAPGGFNNIKLGLSACYSSGRTRSSAHSQLMRNSASRLKYDIDGLPRSATTPHVGCSESHAGNTGGDSDDDGLPDDWEMATWGNLGRSDWDDADADALPAGFEFRFGLKPDRRDIFQVINFDNRVRVVFAPVPGATLYDIQAYDIAAQPLSERTLPKYVFSTAQTNALLDVPDGEYTFEVLAKDVNDTVLHVAVGNAYASRGRDIYTGTDQPSFSCFLHSLNAFHPGRNFQEPAFSAVFPINRSGTWEEFFISSSSCSVGGFGLEGCRIAWSDDKGGSGIVASGSGGSAWLENVSSNATTLTLALIQTSDTFKVGSDLYLQKWAPKITAYDVLESGVYEGGVYDFGSSNFVFVAGASVPPALPAATFDVTWPYAAQPRPTKDLFVHWVRGGVTNISEAIAIPGGSSDQVTVDLPGPDSDATGMGMFGFGRPFDDAPGITPVPFSAGARALTASPKSAANASVRIDGPGGRYTTVGVRAFAGFLWGYYYDFEPYLDFPLGKICGWIPSVWEGGWIAHAWIICEGGLPAETSVVSHLLDHRFAVDLDAGGHLESATLAIDGENWNVAVSSTAPGTLEIAFTSTSPAGNRRWTFENVDGDPTVFLAKRYRADRLQPGKVQRMTRSQDGVWTLQDLDPVSLAVLRETSRATPGTIDNAPVPFDEVEFEKTGDRHVWTYWRWFGEGSARIRRKVCVETSDQMDRTYSRKTWYDWHLGDPLSGAYGLPRLTWTDEGDWTHWTYDSRGRELSVARCWKDGMFETNEWNDTVSYDFAKVTEYDYAPGADVPESRSPRRVSDYVVQGGVKILVDRTWHDVSTVFTNGLYCIRRETVRAASQEAAVSPDSPGNLRSWSLAFPETQDWRNGRTLASTSEDGRLVRHHFAPMVFTQNAEDYAFAPAGAITNCIRIATTTGTAALPDGLPSRSTFSVSYIDARHGQVLKSETRLLSGSGPADALTGHPVLDWTVHLYDANHRCVKTRYADGTFATTARGVCGLPFAETARDGTATLYQYDGMMRRIRTLSASLLPLGGALGLVSVTNVEAVAYDATGRVASRSTYPGRSDGTPLPGHPPLTRTWQWPVENSGGGWKTCEIEQDERGRRKILYEASIQRMHFSHDEINGAQTMSLHRGDGSLQEDLEYIFSVTQEGYVEWHDATITSHSDDYSADGSQISSASKSGGAASESHHDFLGRAEKSLSTAFGGGWLAEVSSYDSVGRLATNVSGQLTSSGTTFESVASETTYAYDELGQLFRTTTTSDGVANVSETHSWYEALSPAQWPASVAAHIGVESAWWRCTASTRIVEGVAITTSVNRVRMTGKSLACTAQSASIDLDGVVSLSTTSFDPATGLTTQTTVRSDGAGADVSVSAGGRIVSSVSATGETADYAYDLFGRVVSTRISTPAERVTEQRQVYNSIGELVQDIEVCGGIAYTNTYVYGGPDGRAVATHTDPVGAIVNRTYLSNGQVLVESGDTRPVSYAYDFLGRLQNMEALRNSSAIDNTFWDYDDPTGLVVSKTYSDSSTVSYDYTPAGQLAARTSAEGETSHYDYSPGGKLLEEDHPLGTDDVLYDYDDQGNLAVAESAQCRYDTFYDYSKLRRDWEHVVLGDVTNAIFRRYDASGRDAGFMALVDIGGANATQDVFRAYDALGRLESISATVNGASPIAVTNFYDGARHVGCSIHAGNCIVLRQVVYAQNRNVIESVINSVVTNGITNVVSRYDYAYDGAGRRVRREDLVAVASTNVFVYNRRSEITGATMNSGVHTYDYDWQGNRLSATNGATGAVYVPDGLNQYDDVGGVAPTYDLEGNLLLIPGRMVMEYDAKNQMTFCSNASWRVWNTYDHLGRRIVKKTQYQNGAPSARHYVYDGWNMIAETMPSGAPNHYLWGLDLSGAEQGAGGVGGLLGYLRGTTWFVPLYDANGNVTSYVNADLGRAVINYEFDAYGKMTSGNPTGIFRFRFSSKYFDVETGLYYYGRRFYDPVWGRWINRDPIEEDGGLNLYAFCENDGVNAVDILGLEPPELNEFFTKEKAKYNVVDQIQVKVYYIPEKSLGRLMYVSETDSQVKCHGGSLHIVIIPRFGVPPGIRPPLRQRGKKIFGSGYGVINNLFIPMKGWSTPPDFWGDSQTIGTRSTMSGFKHPIYHFGHAKFNVGRFIDIKYAGTETWVPDTSSAEKMFRTWHTFRNSVDGNEINAIISSLTCNDEVSIQIGCAGEEKLAWRQVLKVTK